MDYKESEGVHRRDEQSEGAKVAKAVSRLLDNYNDEEKKVFLEQMARDHRTLQQSFTRLCVGWFRMMATPEFRYDGRNEDSVMLAVDMKEVLDRHPLPRI